MSIKSGLNDALAKALYGRNAQWNITSLFYFLVIEVYLRDIDVYVEKRYSYDDYKYSTAKDVVNDIVDDVMKEAESKVQDAKL